MPDKNPEGQPNPNPTPAKPGTPSVPSPPLPSGVKPAAPTPIPSPPLPPKVAPIPSPPVPTATPAPVEKAPEQTAEFKLTGDASGAKAQPAPRPAARSARAPGTPPAPAATPPAPKTPAVPRTPSAAAPQPAAKTPPVKAPTPATPSPNSPNAAAPIGTGAKPNPAPHATTHQEGELPTLKLGTQIRSWINKADPALTLIFRIAFTGLLLALGYILYSIFVVKIGAEAIPASQANLLRVAATVVHWSAVLMAITGILLYLDQKGLGIALVVGGLVLHFGAPWVMFGYVGKTNAVLALTEALRGTGMWLVYLGILRSGFDLMQWIIELPDRKKQRADIGVGRKAEAAQQRVAKDANVFSPCWQLPYCREAIRKQCPAFLAKKTCWKFGRGCYCDEEMISRIIKGEAIELIQAPTRLSKTGKAPCGRCHIYLEHQGYKYKMLSPLAVPLTGLIMFFIWPYWTKFFLAFSNAKFWDAISFDKDKFTPESVATTAVADASAQVSQEQVTQIATVLIGVLMGFFVLIYVCKFIEWFVYKLKF